MISPSAAFLAANAKPNKKPVHLILIDGYFRAFTSLPGLTGTPSVPGLGPTLVQSNSRINAGGLSAKPTDVSLPAGGAGNVVFAFFDNWFPNSGGVPGISDTAGWTWHPVLVNNLSNGTGLIGFGLWWAISDGNANDITFSTADASAQWIDMWVGEYSGLDSSAFDIATGHGSGTYVLDGVSLTYAGSGNIVLLDNPVTSGQQWLLIFLQNGGITPGGSEFFRNSGVVSTNGVTTEAFNWIRDIGDIQITVADLDGSANMSDLIFNVLDYQGEITADLADTVLVGKRCQLLEGFVGMDVSDFLIRFTGVIDAVDSDTDNLEYKFTVTDINVRKLAQKIFLTGDNSLLPIDSKNPLTLSGHPLDLLVTALEQAGVALPDIDTAKIHYYRDLIYNGRFFEFSLTSAPTAKDFIEKELMMPLGMYYRPTNLGQITVQSFYPAIAASGGYTPPVPPVMSFTVSVNPAEVQQNNAPVAQQAEMVNQVVFKFDDDGQGNQSFLSERIVNWDASIAKYGIVGSRTIESQGMRAAFAGHLMAQLIGRIIGLRYGDSALIMDPTSLDWKACVIDPGDIIAVTNPFVPDRKAGLIGVTAKIFEVLDIIYSPIPCTVQAKLLEIDLSKFKQFLITANGEADFTAASSVDQATYMFLSDAAGKYSNGVPANTLG